MPLILIIKFREKSLLISEKSIVFFLVLFVGFPPFVGFVSAGHYGSFIFCEFVCGFVVFFHFLFSFSELFQEILIDVLWYFGVLRDLLFKLFELFEVFFLEFNLEFLTYLIGQGLALILNRLLFIPLFDRNQVFPHCVGKLIFSPVLSNDREFDVFVLKLRAVHVEDKVQLVVDGFDTQL